MHTGHTCQDWSTHQCLNNKVILYSTEYNLGLLILVTITACSISCIASHTLTAIRTRSVCACSMSVTGNGSHITLLVMIMHSLVNYKKTLKNYANTTIHNHIIQINTTCYTISNNTEPFHKRTSQD